MHRLLLIVTLLLAAAGCHSIDSVSPNPAAAGDTITIRGTGLGATQDDSQVLYDGQQLAVLSWTSARIDALLPAAKANGTYAVQVVVKAEFSNALTHTLDTETYALFVEDGTLAFMDGTECPAGWVEFEDGAGRFLVGKSDGAAVGLLVGDALAAGEDRTHGHGYGTTVRIPGAGIIGVTGGGNSTLGRADTYDVSGATDPSDAAVPRIQQLLCERVVTTPPAQVDDHPFPTNAIQFFNRETCPDGFSIYGDADGRFLVPAPAGGDVGGLLGTVGVNLGNGEDRTHDHRFESSITVPQKNVAALGGLNFDHAEKGTRSFTGRTDVASSGTPYVQLLACRANFHLPPPIGIPQSGDLLPPDTFAFFDDIACPSGWTRSFAHAGRFLLGLPEGGAALETRGGAALSNRENRAHSHGFSGSVNLPSLNIALVDGCCFNDTGARGTYGYSGVTDPGSVNMPYLQLLGCEKD